MLCLTRSSGGPSIRAWLFSLALLVASGCSSAENAAPLSANDGDHSDPTNGTVTLSDEDESLRFSPDVPLRLEPQELALLTTRVTPVNGQRVSFDVLTDDTLFDGFLFEDTAEVQDDGKAQVELQAPSLPSTFIVRARVGEVEAQLVVAVSAHGYASLIVKPEYAGVRQVRRWTASARAGMSCEELDSYWIDGPLVGSGVSSASIENVPSGVQIALTLRGDESVSGCTTLTDVGADTAEEVHVRVTDRALRWEGKELELALGITTVAPAFSDHLDEAVTEGLRLWRGEAESDAATLIAAMQESLSAESAEELSAASTNSAYVGLLAEGWQEPDALSSALAQLLTDAAEGIPGPKSLTGSLLFSEDRAALTLTSAAGALPLAAGFEVESVWTVDAESSAALSLGGQLSYYPLTWLSALVELSALPPVTQLNETAQCEAAAQKWTTTNGGQLYPGCDLACAELLCLDALELTWQRVRSGGSSRRLEVGVTGPAEVGTDAYLSGLSGSWIGRFEGEETSVKGDATLSSTPD